MSNGVIEFLKMMLILFVLAPLAFGQTFEIKDRNGVPVMTVNEVKMFRYSSYFKKDIADFECAVSNISGEDLKAVVLHAVVHKKGAAKVEFSFPVNVCEVCAFLKDSTVKAGHQFVLGPSYTPDDFESVEFALPGSWQSPEDRRLAAEAQAKKDAAEKRQAAKERRKIRAACSLIYQNTVDNKVKDLTVREEQQVRTCQALGLYPPPVR